MPLDANAAFTERHDLQTYQLPDPGAGNALVYTVPDNEVLQFVGVRFRLGTPLVVADRRIEIVPLDGLGFWPCQASPSSVLQPVGATWTYWFSCGIAPVDATADCNAVYEPLACGLQLKPGQRLRISWSNMAVTDNLDNVYVRLYKWKQD